jgi:Asp-tRNA(Asn)/Glu-tRNA(Gln) amidotransferase A subunit family amidase
LRRAGASIRSIDIAGMLTKLDEATTTVMFYEGARFHQQRYNEHGARLADMADLVRDGLLISADRYDEARRYIAECRTRMTELYKATPVILVPSATGPAPSGLASTGDARMNAPWTALGTPAISIPLPLRGELPLGLQLTAEHGEDARVIRTAVRLQALLGTPE